MNIKNEILKFYETEDNKFLAERLGISESSLRKKASRLGLKKQIKSNFITSDGKKLCCICKELLPLSHFTKDVYQPNELNYRCKKCMKKPQKSVIMTDLDCHCDSTPPIQGHAENRAGGFGIKKTRNPILHVNGVPSLRCKVCTEVKPLEDFHRAKGNITGRKNVCKRCFSKK